jgi:hypothetical protein
MNDIKKFILDLENKDKEIKKNPSNIKSIVSEINNLIDDFLKKNELPKKEKEALEILKQSYSSNLKLLEKRNQIESKKQLIKENLKRKYLEYEIIEKSLNFKIFSEYEVLNEPLLNEIEEECNKLISTYEGNLIFNKKNKDLLQGYFQDLKTIKEKIKLIKNSNMSFDTKKINKIKIDIDLIKQEIQKINQKLENINRYFKNQK